MLRGVAASSGVSAGITIGTTTITGGATTQVLFNLAGVVSSRAGFEISAANRLTATGGVSLVATGGTADAGNFVWIGANSAGAAFGLRNAGVGDLAVFIKTSGADAFRVSAAGNLSGGSTSAAIFYGSVAPTVASGGCLTGAGTVITNSNGTAHFTTTLGTGCSGSQPIVFTLPAATVGWRCGARNVSNPASSVPSQTGAVSTTSVTITNYARTTGLAAAWTDSDVVVVSCLGG